MDKYFASQQDDEQVMLVIRKHWFVLIPALSLIALLYFIGFLMVFVVPVAIPQLVSGLVYNIYVLFVSLLFLYNTGFLFSAWVIYYLNVGIITTEHIVEINQHGLFSRKIAQLGFDKIQDVSAEQKGIAQTMFNYGHVDVQTAGELPNFVFRHIPNPNEVAQKIMEIEENYMDKNKNYAAGNNGQIDPGNLDTQATPPTIEFPGQ